MTVCTPKIGTVRVLLVDNNPDYLAAVARLLRLDPRVEIVGRAFSGAETLRQVAAVQPDLVLLDIAVGPDNGLEIARQLKQTPHPPKVVMTALYDDGGYGAAAVAAGAAAFVSQSNLALELPPLLRELF